MNMTMRKRKAALCACSDPLSEARRPQIEQLVNMLEARGLTVTASPYLFGCAEPDQGKSKAYVLSGFFADPEMEFVFDVSGGDLANTVLRHLDYSAIRNSRAHFYGFSDLTTVINAIYTRTGREAVNYQVRNIAALDEAEQYFDRAVLQHRIKENDLEAEMLRGDSIRGRVIGGNLRCMLKLAGTQFWPDMRGKVLLLESLGGGVSQMTTMIEQYMELGAAEMISGVLLGTFTNMEREGLKPSIEEIVLRAFPREIPVARTRFVGHGSDARAIVIGREIEIGKIGE